MKNLALHISLRILTTLLLFILVISINGKETTNHGNTFNFPTNVPDDYRLPVKGYATLQVYFRQNLSEVDESYMGNKASIEAFVDTVNNYIKEEGFTITRIKITATASPEGEYTFNNNLSLRRAQAIKDELAKRLDTSKTVIEAEGKGENWVGLYNMLKESDFYAKDLVLRIIGPNPEKNSKKISALRKRVIKVQKRGQVWKDLLDQYYPTLRLANNRIEFEFVKTKYIEKQETVTQTPEVVVPQQTDTIMPDIEKIIKYPLLSVKTNILYDVFYTKPTGFQPIPNFELEYYLKNGRWSILAEYEFPWWSNWEKKTFFQLQNWQVEPRYYLKNDHWYNGHFFGVFIGYSRYDFCLKGKDGDGDQGEGIGAGISYGYVLPIGKKSSRWKIEFNIKAGYYETHYDPYEFGISSVGEEKYYYKYYGDPDDFIRRNQRWRWFGPMGVGITISYDLLRGYKQIIK